MIKVHQPYSYPSQLFSINSWLRIKYSLGKEINNKNSGCYTGNLHWEFRANTIGSTQLLSPTITTSTLRGKVQNKSHLHLEG